MPAFICVSLVPLLMALAIAFRASGRKRGLAWAVFVLLALPLLVAGGGGMLLESNGLAWRSCVKLPCGFAYVAGVLALLVWAGVFLWKLLADWGPLVQCLGKILILLGVGFLCLAVGWYGVLFSAIWAGDDRVVERDGRKYVEEHVWMDSDFYEYSDYCGPLVRGKNRLFTEN